VALAYLGVMLGAQVAKYQTFGMGFDLALQEQILWNSAHGRWLATSTLAHARSDLGRDLIPLELILVIPYALLPSTYTLLVLQTLAVLAGLLAIARLAGERLGPWGAVAFALAYVAYVPLHRLNLYEFQLRAFAIAPLVLAFRALERQRLVPFLCWLGAVLCTRSDLALVVALFGAYAIFRRRPWPFAAGAFVLGVAWFCLAVFVVVPRFNETGRLQYVGWFGNLGSTPQEVVASLLHHPEQVWRTVAQPRKLAFLASVYGPLAFIPLFRPDILLLSLPSLAMGFLSSHPQLSDVRYQYATSLYPVAFVAAISAVEAASRRLAQARPWMRGALYALVPVCAATTHMAAPPPTWRLLRSSTSSEQVQAAVRILSKIPADAAVAATSTLGPHLARREHLYHYPPWSEGFYSSAGLARADYIAVDAKGDGDEAVDLVRSDPAFVLIAERDRYMLFRRRAFVRRERREIAHPR
jgi:uncharacterized membrane protein